MAKFSKKAELENQLKKVVNRIIDEFDVEKCSLMILGENNALEIIASQGIAEEIVKNTKIKYGEGISGMVVKEGKEILVKSIDLEKLSKSPGTYKTSSFISFPIKVKNQSVGVINITDKKSNSPFEEKDIQALQSFADEVANVLAKKYIL